MSDYIYKGVDLSHHNGTVNFTKLKNAGYQFVLLRAGWGSSSSQKDKKFEENYAKAKAAGLYVGCYWFSYATTVAEGVKEANAFLSVIKGKTFEFPCYYDVEYKKTLEMTKSNLTKLVNDWCTTVEKNSQNTAGFYTFYATLNKFNLNEIRYEKWLAKWSKSMGTCTTDEWSIWQKEIIGTSSESTIRGSVPGCEQSSGVDIDYCYKDYITNKPATTTNPVEVNVTPIVEEKETVSTTTVIKSNELILNHEALYTSSNSPTPVKNITGLYYIYSDTVINGRIRITNNKNNIGKLPSSKYVTGWIKAPSNKTSTIEKETNKTNLTSGTKVVLRNINLYSSANSKIKVKAISGIYYIYNNTITNNRIRITNSVNNVNKNPAGSYVTGWINISDIT